MWTRKNSPKTINECFPDWADNKGIFSFLSTFSLPWAEDESLTASILDLLYHGDRSGEKLSAPILRRMGELTDANRLSVATAIYAIYRATWEKQWETLIAEYDPIVNYDMVETMEGEDTTTYGKTATRTDNLTHGKTGTETTAGSSSETDNAETYGFSSAEPVPANDNTRSSSGSTTVTHNTQSTDSGTETHVDSGSDTTNKGYTLTRKGNIGVMTTQQIITQIHDLWKWNFFQDVVFPDIDRVLTLQIY